MVRKLILDRLTELRLNRAEVSKRLDRNPTYLQQFLTKGSPRELPERERLLLAEILKVPEDQLRGPSLPVKPRGYMKHSNTREGLNIDAGSLPVPNEIGAQLRILPGASLYGNTDLPVYGSAQGGDGALVITDSPVDWVARPSMLLRVQDGYGMIVVGDSMDPAIKAGTTALINPNLPPRVGDLGLFRKHAEDGSWQAVVKEYRGETETTWKVRQHNPAKDFTLRKSEWQVCHRIVGTYFS